MGGGRVGGRGNPGAVGAVHLGEIAVTLTFPWTAVAALAGALLLGIGGWAIARIVRARSSGALLAADDGRAAPVDLVSDRLGLVGRPDEIRRLRDGRPVPVEIKSRTAPASGVFPSHRVQVEAYCALLESRDGRPPSYGVVVYRGGVQRIVPWNSEARNEVIRLLVAIRAPYDGRATPSPGKCRGCRWRDGCDARAG